MRTHRFGRFLRARSAQFENQARLRVEILEDRSVPAVVVGPPVAAAPYQSSDILVCFKPGVSISGLAGNDFAAGTSIGEAVGLAPGLYQIHLGAGVSVDGAIAAYSASSFVAYAQPDFQIHLEVTPNDPQYPTQWDLNNTGQNGGTPGVDIGAPAAWELTTGTGKTTVAVIDTGVDYNHPDLYLNAWINQAEIPTSRMANLIDINGDGQITFRDLNDPINQGVGKITDINGDGRIDGSDILAPMQKSGGQDNGLGGWADGISQDGDTAHLDDLLGWNFVSNTNNPMDDNNHGTHCSGTIGAIGNNGVGIAGIDWNVQIMALKFLDSSGSGSTSDSIKALDYAVAHGATISNNSYGGDPYSQALYDAINNAGKAGHIYVAAAGNGNWLGIGQDNDQNPFYPASYNLANLVAVAATDSSDNLAFFSNYGATSVDLAAPGVGILSTTRNNTYSSFDGTSMATPHVTGALALVRDLHPDWTYGQVISQILNSVDVIPSLQGKVVTGGRLNLARAVLPPPVIDVNWIGGSLSGPANADWQSTFTVNRTYNIQGEDAQHDFSISYYASLDSTLDNDDLFLGSESITAAADKTMGTHSGTSPSFQIVNGGAYHLFAVVDSGGAIYETDETNNAVASAQTVLVTGPMILDNSQSVYSESGTGWTNWTAAGYGGSLRYHAAGTGANTATWQTSDLAPGYYLIQTTWNADRSHATNAPFSIYDGTTLLQSALVNQQNAPSGTTIGNTTFQNLATINLTTGSLKVVLSDNGNGDVVADAIRLVPIPAPVIDLDWSGGGVTGPTSTDTQTPFTINRTYTISGEAASANFNISYYASSDATFGNGDDLLLGSEIVSAAADQTVGTHSGVSPNLQITTGGTFYLFAKVDGGGSILETNEGNNVNQAPQAVTVSAPIILDNAQAGYSESGSGWLSWSAGFGGNLRYHAAGTGANTATWQTTGLAAGYYTIQATWNSDANHAGNAPFAIYDGTTLIKSVAVNEKPSPTGALVGGVRFQDIATVQVTSGTLKIVLSDAANGYIVADAVRLVPLAPPVADLNWTGGGIAGPASTTVQTNFNINRTYAISGGAIGSDFTISYYASTDATFGNGDDILLGSETITAGGDKSVGSHAGTSPNLQIGTGGVYYLFAKTDSANVVLETDETNNVAQAAQTILVSGPVIVDNSQAGYSETGSGWLGWSSGYAGNLRYHAAGTGANKANWQISGLASGYYQVQADWNGDTNHASNAPYSFYDGSTLVQTALVNQRPVSSGTALGGVQFQNIATVHITSGTLKVVLADNANGYVVADAVRVVPLPAPNIDLNWSGGGICGPANADFQTPFTLSRMYTIAGADAASDFTIGYYASVDAVFGNADDLLLGSETISAAADKTIGSHDGTSPSLLISTGGTFYLFAKIDNGAAIFETDDTNNLAQAAQTVAVAGPTIIDNSQPGYSETGAGWLSWSSGYLGNLRYHAAGSGVNTANWQSTGLPAGYYLVQATWNADANHANNAPFAIYDGSTLVQSVAVNQRSAPSGTLVGGVQFQTIATVQITSGTAHIVLSDAGNGYVVADAIRLVPTNAPLFFGSSSSGSETSSAPVLAAGGQESHAPKSPHKSAASLRVSADYLQMLANFSPADLGLRVDFIPLTGQSSTTDRSPTFRASYLENEFLVAKRLRNS